MDLRYEVNRLPLLQSTLNVLVESMPQVRFGVDLRCY